MWFLSMKISQTLPEVKIMEQLNGSPRNLVKHEQVFTLKEICVKINNRPNRDVDAAPNGFILIFKWMLNYIKWFIILYDISFWELKIEAAVPHLTFVWHYSSIWLLNWVTNLIMFLFNFKSWMIYAGLKLNLWYFKGKTKIVNILLFNILRKCLYFYVASKVTLSFYSWAS